MIPFLDLFAINERYRQEIEHSIQEVLDSGWYLQGEKNKEFCKNFASYCGTKYCLGVANGLDALRLIIRGYGFGAGDEIIVPEPAYANYMSFAVSAGAVIRTVATTIEEGFCLPKVEKFEELINERTKAILICNPNNPTGYLYTQREMNQIRDLVKKYNL